MRFISMFALLAATTALGGCPAGDGAALSLASSKSVCGVNAGQCATVTPTPVPTPTPTPTTPTTPAPNTGNTASIPTGDPTITVEGDLITSTNAKPAISTLTQTAGLNGYPNTAKIEIDTHTATNASWPIAKTMKEYLPGTNAYANPNGIDGSALGGNYKEYRAYSRDPKTGTAVDEELQVWSFNHSYVAQYRDVTSGGNPPAHQAWSFGGTKTPAAAMTLKGSGTYAGKFTAIAKTSNYIDPNTVVLDANGNVIIPLSQTLSRNNTWAVVGDSNLTADFFTGAFTGTLSPTTWRAFQTMNGGIGFKDVDANNASDPNWGGYMDNQVNLIGKIDSGLRNGIPVTGNTIVGTATMDPSYGWLTDETNNAMYASVYGPNAEEITGAFGVDADQPQPLGGKYPITDDRRGYITMSGVFNGQ
jgi:hypothetical protein